MKTVAGRLRLDLAQRPVQRCGLRMRAPIRRVRAREQPQKELSIGRLSEARVAGRRAAGGGARLH